MDASLDARSDDQRLLQLSKFLFVTRCTVRVRVEGGLKIFVACLLSYKVCVDPSVQKSRNISFSTLVRGSPENPKLIADPIKLARNNMRCLCGKKQRQEASFCLEGAIIVLACIIFSVITKANPEFYDELSAAAMVWSYIGQVVFNMLILVGTIKMSDRIVKEMMGL